MKTDESFPIVFHSIVKLQNMNFNFETTIGVLYNHLIDELLAILHLFVSKPSLTIEVFLTS